MKNLLKKQFTALSKSELGTPKNEWVQEFRSTLMMGVKNTVANSEPRSLAFFKNVFDLVTFIFPKEQLRLATRTATVLTLVLGIVFSGSITTVSAALNSIPGDFLYPLKLMTEGAQVRLASGDTEKAELHVEFAGRRIQEVVKINENEENLVDNKVRTAVAVEGFKQEMVTVNQYMEQSEPEQAAAIAKIVDAKSEEHEQILLTVEKTISDTESRGVVTEAKTVVENTGIKAVEVIVVTHTTTSSTVTSAEVKNTVTSKINDIEKRVERLSELAFATSTPINTKEAKTAIGEARALNLSGDFSSALSKIKESTELVRAVAALTVTVSTDTGNTTTPTVLNISNSSTTQLIKVQAQGLEQNTGTLLQIQSIGDRVDESSTTPRIIQP